MLHQWRELQIKPDLKCMEWESKKRSIRKFDDGTKIYFFHGDSVDMIVNFRAESATGPHWTVEITYYPDLKNQHRRIRLWSCGKTRREAFKEFKLEINGYRELLNLISCGR